LLLACEANVTDLTRGPIGRHIVSMASFIAAGLLFQSAYFIVDLYFVSRIGKQAVAGVSSSGNVFYLGLAAAQLVGVGSLSLISQAIGRRDTAYASLVFNQVMVMSLLLSAISLIGGYAFAGALSTLLTANGASAAYGKAYLFGFLPSLAGMFPGTVLGASLRATGVVRPTMLLQTGSVLLNALLAPVLIAGWGTGHALGPFGAGLASSISSLGGLAVIVAILPRIQSQLRWQNAALWPRLHVWIGLMRVGLPAAGEFLLMFLINVAIYWSIRRFGPAAQAGYGIGARVMQALFLPTMAISFAASPIAGQNFGAGQRARVLETFRTSLIYVSALMLAITVICQVRPEVLAGPFTQDPAVLAICCQYLRLISWNFVGVGVVFSCSGMFQALGDTVPTFISSASRLITFVVPCIVLAGYAPAVLPDFWIVSIVSASLQAVFSLWLLKRVFRRKLPPETETGIAAAAAT
jgi:putative MATE family efflux protein